MTLEIERAQYLNSTDMSGISNFSNDDYKNVKMCSFCHLYGHLSSECKRKRTNSIPIRKYKSVTKDDSFKKDTGVKNERCNKLITKNRSKIICWKCKGIDHLLKDCDEYHRLKNEKDNKLDNKNDMNITSLDIKNDDSKKTCIEMKPQLGPYENRMNNVTTSETVDININKNKDYRMYFNSNDRPDIICWNCFEKGHQAMNCINDSRIDYEGILTTCELCSELHNINECVNILCPLCKNINHSTKTCEEVAYKLGEKCQICYEDGHVARECNILIFLLKNVCK